MSTPTENNQKPSYIREKKPGFLEKLGVNYYCYLGKKSGTANIPNLTIDELPSDITMQTLAGIITAFAAIIAFAVGAITTFVTIWVEWTYQGTMDDTQYYLLFSSVLVVMLILELAVLFWLGLKTVYSLACLTGQNQTSNQLNLPLDDAAPNILARAALEVPDPVINWLGIDPLKHLSKSRLFLVGFLYKVKVILSSMTVKLLLIRIFGKGGARTAFSWVAIPITSFWDAFTLYKVAREARLRLFGHKLVEYIVSNILTEDMIKQLSPIAREGAIRALATIMVLAQHYHPNLLILLLRISDTFNIKEDNEYDNWEEFLLILDQVSDSERYFLLDLLSVSAAFDGHLSRLEKHHLPEAFKDLTDIYLERTRNMRNMLMSGQLHAAKELCKLDFIPG